MYHGATADDLLDDLMNDRTRVADLAPQVLDDLAFILSARHADDDTTIDQHIRLHAAVAAAHAKSGDIAEAAVWLSAFDVDHVQLIDQIRTRPKPRPRAA